MSHEDRAVAGVREVVLPVQHPEAGDVVAHGAADGRYPLRSSPACASAGRPPSPATASAVPPRMPAGRPLLRFSASSAQLLLFCVPREIQSLRHAAANQRRVMPSRRVGFEPSAAVSLKDRPVPSGRWHRNEDRFRPFALQRRRAVGLRDRWSDRRRAPARRAMIDRTTRVAIQYPHARFGQHAAQRQGACSR